MGTACVLSACESQGFFMSKFSAAVRDPGAAPGGARIPQLRWPARGSSPVPMSADDSLFPLCSGGIDWVSAAAKLKELHEREGGMADMARRAYACQAEAKLLSLSTAPLSGCRGPDLQVWRLALPKNIVVAGAQHNFTLFSLPIAEGFRPCELQNLSCINPSVELTPQLLDAVARTHNLLWPAGATLYREETYRESQHENKLCAPCHVLHDA